MDTTSTTSNSSANHGLPQILVINPRTALTFKGPASQTSTVQMTLTNPSNKWVAFKVKTTAPKRYCVRPNGGLIKGGDTLAINIVYQPGDGNDAGERARHKFLVQAIFVDNEQVNLDAVWRDVPKDRLMESKIRCIFEDTEPGDAQDRQPAPQGTVHVGPGANVPMDATLVKDDHPDQPAKTPRGSEPSSGGVELELRRLAEDYRRAQDEIANLRDENRRLRDDGVRMRKSLQSVGQSTSSGSTSSVSQTHPQDLVTSLKTDLPKMHVLLALAVALLVGAIFSQVLF